MDYYFLPEAARDLQIPVAHLKELCEQSRVNGAVRFGRVWILPRPFGLAEVSRSITEGRRPVQSRARCRVG